MLLEFSFVIFNVHCMFLQSLSLKLFGWMYFIHDNWINWSMDGWYWWRLEWHPNGWMPFIHSYIVFVYTIYMYYGKNNIYYLVWSLWMPSTIGMTFISSISLLWPILGGGVYESALLTTIPGRQIECAHAHKGYPPF